MKINCLLQLLSLLPLAYGDTKCYGAICNQATQDVTTSVKKDLSDHRDQSLDDHGSSQGRGVKIDFRPTINIENNDRGQQTSKVGLNQQGDKDFSRQASAAVDSSQDEHSPVSNDPGFLGHKTWNSEVEIFTLVLVGAAILGALWFAYKGRKISMPCCFPRDLEAKAPKPSKKGGCSCSTRSTTTTAPSNSGISVEEQERIIEQRVKEGIQKWEESKKKQENHDELVEMRKEVRETRKEVQETKIEMQGVRDERMQQLRSTRPAPPSLPYPTGSVPSSLPYPYYSS